MSKITELKPKTRSLLSQANLIVGLLMEEMRDEYGVDFRACAEVNFTVSNPSMDNPTVRLHGRVPGGQQGGDVTLPLSMTVLHFGESWAMEPTQTDTPKESEGNTEDGYVKV